MLVGLSLRKDGTTHPDERKGAETVVDVSVELAGYIEAVAEKRCKLSFGKVFQYFAPRLRSYAIKQLGNEALAMELVQDTMSNVWQKAHLFNSLKGSASTWVFTIARNLRFDLLRKQQNRKEDVCSEDLWPILVEQNAYVDEESVDETVTLDQILDFVEKLPEKQKQVIYAIYVQGKSQQEVADEINTPLGTIKSRTRLGLQKLKELLNANG